MKENLKYKKTCFVLVVVLIDSQNMNYIIYCKICFILTAKTVTESVEWSVSGQK